MHWSHNPYLFEACESCDVMTIVLEIAKILDDSRIRSFFYLGLRMPGHKISEGELPLILTNISTAWAKAYRREDRHLSDPTMRRACSSRVPLLMTSRELEHLSLSLIATNASMTRPTKGIVVPIHGPDGELAVFNVLGRWDGVDPVPGVMEISDIHMLALNVHATVTECALQKRKTAAVLLTVREKECLLLTARGKTAWEISKIMARSRGTVNFHLQNAMRKLDAVNKTQATAKATELGLLTA